MKLGSVLLAAWAAAEVVELNATDFEALTGIGSDHQEDKWFIKFYSPVCHHCMAIEDAWEQMSEKVSDVKVGAVNVVKERALSQRYNVTGVPRLLLFEVNGKVYRHKGKRNAESFAKFAAADHSGETEY